METTLRAEKREVWQEVVVCILLVLAVLAVFGQTAHFDFVNYDDPAFVYDNPVVERGLSAQSVSWAFTHSQVSNWVPLTTLSHMLDCQMFGLQAGGHHLVNVLLHAANAVLVFLVLRQMTGSLWRSAFVAAVFAVHPLRAESVAWVSERKDVLSGIFFLLTIWAYVRQVRRPSTVGYVGMVLLFALGLMAKSMVATLPFVLLLLDYWPLGRMKGMQNAECRMLNAKNGGPRSPGVPFWGLVKEKIPLFAISAGACVVAARMPGLLVAQQLPLFERLGNALVSYGVYLRQMVYPAGLAAHYPISPHGQSVGRVCLALVVLGAVSVGVWMGRVKRPWLLTGWLWYLGMLFPVIGIMQISNDAAHADRYTYLPEIGLAVAGAWAVGDWSARWKHGRVVLGGFSLAILTALVLCAHTQTSYWRNGERLWTHALACTTRNSFAHYSLGIAFFKMGEMNEAIVEYQQALSIKPDFAIARSNLGAAFDQKGDLDESIEEYRKALEIQPASAETLVNLGNVLSKKGRFNDAQEQYRRAEEIDPGYEDAYFNEGIALFNMGDAMRAIAQYRKALTLNPNDAAALNSLGMALAKEGRLVEAVSSYRDALRITPFSADTYDNLALVLIQEGKTKEAIDCWQKGLEINPSQLSILNNLAWPLATASDASLRNGARAVTLTEQANRLAGGGNPIILHTMAAAYAAVARFGDAISTARRALELAKIQKNDQLAATLEREIKLYETGAPIRDSPQ